MSPANRYRLVHALVTKVVVDEASGKAHIRLADLGVDTTAEPKADDDRSQAPPALDAATSPPAEASS